MKAAVIHEFGDVDVLRYEDIATFNQLFLPTSMVMGLQVRHTISP